MRNSYLFLMTASPASEGTLEALASLDVQAPVSWIMPGMREHQGWQVVHFNTPDMRPAALLDALRDAGIQAANLKRVCESETPPVDYTDWPAVKAILNAGKWYLLTSYSAEQRVVLKRNGQPVMKNDQPKKVLRIEQAMPRWLLRFVASSADEAGNEVRPTEMPPLHVWAGNEIVADLLDAIDTEDFDNDTPDEYELPYVADKVLRRIDHEVDYRAAIDALPDNAMHGYLRDDVLREQRRTLNEDRTSTTSRIDELQARDDALSGKLTSLAADLAAATKKKEKDAIKAEVKDVESKRGGVAEHLASQRGRRSEVNAQLERIAMALNEPQDAP